MSRMIDPDGSLWLVGLIAFLATALAFLSITAAIRHAGASYRRGFHQMLERELPRLHLFVDARRLMWLHLTGMAGLSLVAVVVTGSEAAGLAVMIGGALVPRLTLEWLARRRLAQLRKQMPDMMALLAAGLRAGAALSAVLPRAADDLAAPMRDELRLLERERRLGATLDQALARLELRIPLEETKLLVSVLRLGAQAGGGIATALDAQAMLLRRRLLLESKIGALTAQARLQAWVMGLLPFGVLAAMVWIDPSLAALYFDTPVGWALLATVAMLQLAGGWSILRMVRIRF